MTDIDILTDILNTYTGLPEFHMSTIRCIKYDGQPYHIYFGDGINFRFLVKRNADLQELSTSIYNRYLDESKEYGMGMR